MGLMQSIISNTVNSLPIAEVKEIGSSKNQEDVDVLMAKEITNIHEPKSLEDWVTMDIGYGIDARYELHDMYMTVKRLELEDWIKNTELSKLNYSKESDMISNGLEDNNHSGFSYSCCLMRTKEVYDNGWYPKYCKEANDVHS